MSDLATRDLWPLMLYEAVLSLYPAGPDGQPGGDALWWGAVANGLRLSLEYDEQLMMSSGDAYNQAHHLDERHSIEIERTWLMRKSALSDFVPQRNQRYVLEIVWSADSQWYRRTYLGVTGRSAGWDSQRALQFGSRQSYRAEQFTEDSGAVYTPLPATPASFSEEQCVGFFRENPMVVGEYLLGCYRWPVPVQLTSARVVAFAPQNAPQVLTLEVGGTLTACALNIPVGLANTEVSAQATPNITVPVGQSVRWKITSGPATEDAAYVCAVALQIAI